MKYRPNKYGCSACYWTGSKEDRLTAPNPFDKLSCTIIEGCPRCELVNTLHKLCDVPDCVTKSTCGFPHPDGYMFTCRNHSLKQIDEINAKEG